MPWLAEKPDGCEIEVKVTPRASRNEIGSTDGERLAIRVTAAPDAGAANQAVVKLLAKRLRIGRTSVVIVSGQSARLKRIRIVGMKEAEVRGGLAS